MNKKGTVVLITIIVILAIVILILGLVNVAGRECNNNGDCENNKYCGSDYSCHAYPDQIVVDKSSSYVPAALILGIALIIAAYIFRNGSFSPKKES